MKKMMLVMALVLSMPSLAMAQSSDPARDLAVTILQEVVKNGKAPLPEAPPVTNPTWQQLTEKYADKALDKEWCRTETPKRKLGF